MVLSEFNNLLPYWKKDPHIHKHTGIHTPNIGKGSVSNSNYIFSIFFHTIVNFTWSVNIGMLQKITEVKIFHFNQQNTK